MAKTEPQYVRAKFQQEETRKVQGRENPSVQSGSGLSLHTSSPFISASFCKKLLPSAFLTLTETSAEKNEHLQIKHIPQVLPAAERPGMSHLSSYSPQ